ncbi:pyridoxine 5'-phosphate synthase [Roseivivax sp. THAF30]|uniref:pyridoxine 5'-phosphate synthase n=1 Tax=Roseivivax sp. THAF30 TaxID=2587852 RepID=UPI0012680545|nr:pyridoxine 5'-phosphate synthase [Roseivivax sp. THAF30]QFT61783.1 Pyridoxine 5'-phosphate synthase [Roseivivax sp. THAF30]
MTVLSVNMNVAALLRNRRNHPWPSVVDLGRAALAAGAVGLTVHPRPDERHTRASDVRDLRALIDAEFPNRELNVEGYPDARFLSLVREVRADQVTLVPDAADQATSDHGWDFHADRARLEREVSALKADGHRISLFADPDTTVMAAAADTGADRVELYTGPYGGAHSDVEAQERELDRLAGAAKAADDHGMRVNAGHDLTVPNTAALVARVPALAEVSIGHALFCDALTYGMEGTVQRYLTACRSVARDMG